MILGPDSAPRPRFVHDCSRCCFTGHYIAEGREVDGWYCAGTVLGGSIILRYGDAPPDYGSVPLVVAMNCIDDHLDPYRRVLADYNAANRIRQSLQY